MEIFFLGLCVGSIVGGILGILIMGAIVSGKIDDIKNGRE